MSERCHNCGTELFAGQQFCRRCGAPVRAEDAGEAPTRMLGGQGGGRETGGAYDPELTAPFGAGAPTDPSMRPPPTAPQAPFVRFNPTRPLAPAAARGGRARWLLPFALGVTLAGVGAGLIYMNSARQTSRAKRPAEVRKVVVTAPHGPHAPPLPPEAVEAIEQAAEGAGRGWEELASLAPMDEEGAVTDGEETVITKSYPLEAGGAFLVKSAKGDVKVEGWDGKTAEVRVVKRGGSAEERRAAPVMFGMKGGRLVLAGAAGPRGPVEVRYEIKVPRALRQLEVSADSGDVEVGQLDGTVVVDVKTGDVKIGEVSGAVRGKLIKGDMSVAYGGGARKGPQEYSVVRGNVSVIFGGPPKADLKAETMDGEIEVDDRVVPLKVEKRPAGKRVVGRLGPGGEPLLIKVVDGDIKLKN